MDRYDHKLTIHQIPTNTPQKKLHQIDLQEHQGEHCIEDQKEIRSHLATKYGPVGLLTHHRRGSKDDEEPLRDRCPLWQCRKRPLDRILWF